MKKITNEVIEMITVRLYSMGDTHAVQEILEEMTEAFKDPVSSHRSIRLYKSEEVENDWAIYLNHPATEKNKKSDLARRLVETLRSFGLVNHTVWKPCDTQEIDALL